MWIFKTITGDYMLNEMPLISIIVPVYKVEKYLDRCVNSLINQTYKNIEIILVDDGSPDNCPVMCDKWAENDNRIKVIRKQNGGVSSARNVGLNIAAGEYIGFVDSDDWVDEDMYSHLFFLIEAYNADISCIDFFKMTDEKCVPDKKKEIIKIYDNEKYLKKFFKIGSQETVYYTWNKLYKKSLIPDNPFPSSYSVGEDVIATYLMIRNAQTVVSSSKKMYFYRQNSGITSDFNPAVFNLTSVWDDVCKIAESDGEINYKYALINRKRIPFTILSKLAISGEFKNYNHECDSLLTELNKNKNDLLHSDISLSRKILIFLFCAKYNLFAFLINIFPKRRK